MSSQSNHDSGSGTPAEPTYTMRLGSPYDFVPQRVVSLVPSVTESLFDLAVGSRVVGVTDYCTRPAAETPQRVRVGGTKNPNIPLIISLQPDLIIMNREENRKADADALKAAGFTVWETHPTTVREALNLLWDMMDVFEEASMVPRVRQIEVSYEWTLGLTANWTPRRVFCPIWRDPWMTFNADTYIHDLLLVCGAANVFAERDRKFPLKADLGQQAALAADDPRIAGRDTRYPRISLDEVVAAQPDLVLLPDEPYPFGQQDADEIAQLDIPAARSGQIKLVDGSLLTWHGTRLAHALLELPPLIDAIQDQVTDGTNN
jgi:ABC-type Fe3+-hydroxamate transport system substrate-binding protein